MSRAPGQQTGLLFLPMPPLPRVLWGKDKGALGGQREAWWAAETEGEGNGENKALGASAVITQQQRERKTSGNNMKGSEQEGRTAERERERGGGRKCDVANLGFFTEKQQMRQM